MKTVIKPKKGWRSPIGFLIRSAMDSAAALEPPPELAFADAVPRSTLRRSWFLRSPQSTWLAEQESPGENRAKLRTAGAASRRKTRLPSVAKRRTTLIEILRAKREQVEVFG